MTLSALSISHDGIHELSMEELETVQGGGVLIGLGALLLVAIVCCYFCGRLNEGAEIHPLPNYPDIPQIPLQSVDKYQNYC
jgi:lactobin A/cerein 7B family class IIb bacteriocin